MGFDNRITSIVGNEVTGSVPNPPAFPDSIGHLNAWPLPIEPNARRDGSIEDEFVAPNLVYSRLRAQGAEVIQYNHPRAGLFGERKRHQVQGHVPIHKITIPASVLDGINKADDEDGSGEKISAVDADAEISGDRG